MAQTLEDVLARRMRFLFLDSKVAGEIAQSVAEFMALRLNWDEERVAKGVAKEVADFNTLVEQYSL